MMKLSQCKFSFCGAKEGIYRDGGARNDDYFNATATVDDTGSVDERYGYEAYGSRRVMDASFNSSTSTTTTSPVAYGGYILDDESGLYHVRNRYLHPKLGRWTSRHPIGYQGGINLYGYAASNPVNGVDPDYEFLSVDSVTSRFRFCIRRRRTQDVCDSLAAYIPDGRRFMRLCTSCTKRVGALRKKKSRKLNEVLTTAEDICLGTCLAKHVEGNYRCTDCEKESKMTAGMWKRFGITADGDLYGWGELFYLTKDRVKDEQDIFLGSATCRASTPTSTIIAE